jgi:hypothetical protein
VSGFLICVSRGNTFMADDAVNQSGQGSATECRIFHASAEYRLDQGHAGFIARVRSLRTSGVSVPGGSDPSGRAGRSFRDYSADHDQTPRENSASFASVRKKQRADHRGDCDSRVGFVSRYSEKTWLSRAHCTARFKFTLTLYLIACTIQSSLRLTAFLSRFESVRLAAA